MIKKAIITMLCFLVVALGITFFMIYETNSHKENKSYDWTLGNNKISEKGVDPYGTYDENDLKIEDIKYSYKNDFVNGVQVSGLKDKNIETTINEKIKNGILDMLKENNNLSPQDSYTYLYGNFANILSIYVSQFDNENYVSYYDAINIDLRTGEDIKFEDLFVKNANLELMVYDAFRSDFVIDQYYDDINKYYQEHDYVATEEEPKFIVSIDEDEVYDLTYRFLKEPNKIFYITPNSVTLVFENRWAAIDLYKFREYVALYDRYQTKTSIYTDSSVGEDDIFNFSTPVTFYERIKYGFELKNLFIDFVANEQYDYGFNKEEQDKVDAARKIQIDEQLQQITDVINEAKRNPNTMYIYFVGIDSYPDMNNDYFEDINEWKSHLGYTMEFNINRSLNKIPMALYEEKFRDRLYEQYRQNYFPSSTNKELYYDYENVPDGYEHDSYNVRRLYDFANGNVYEKLEDIVVEDSNYKAILFDAINDRLSDYGVYADEETINAMLETAKYSISNNGIDIEVEQKYIEEYGYFYFFTEFERFDEDMLKIGGFKK